MAGQALVDHGRLLDVLGIEGELLAGLAHSAVVDAAVPHCPGLTVGETVRHVGSGYRVVLAWLRDQRKPEEWQRDPMPGQTLEEYLRSGLAGLLDELRAHEPGERAPTWWPADETYGFWRRRMAHETTIHRIDVQAAGGREPSGIADDIAVDGVDEILSLWFGHRLSMLGLSGTRVASIAVRTAGQSWIVHTGPSAITAWKCSAAEAAQAEATVSGYPAQVYLWLWGRASPAAIGTEGDMDAVGQLWALLRLATR
jgi:uncharacterized protein (TIGR03083 family)